MTRELYCKGRKFEIHGNKDDDYYSVYGVSLIEVKSNQHKLDSFVPSRSHVGKFKRLKDAKKFIQIVMGDIS